MLIKTETEVRIPKNTGLCVSLTYVTPPKSIPPCSRFKNWNSFPWNSWSKSWSTHSKWFFVPTARLLPERSECINLTQGRVFVSAACVKDTPSEQSIYLAYIFSQSKISLKLHTLLHAGIAVLLNSTVTNKSRLLTTTSPTWILIRPIRSSFFNIQ